VEHNDFLLQKEIDERKMTSSYHMWPEPVSFMDVTSHSLQDRPDIINHIIVCGIHSSIQDFIMPLRARYLKEQQL